MDSSTSAAHAVRARVLLVDDSPAVLTLVSHVLEPDFTVIGTLPDAESLVAAWPNARADVIVLDISLPGQTGLEVIGHLRAVGCHAHVVFLSVHEEPDIVSAAWAAGGTAYVAKRDLGSELVPAIRAALKGQRFISTAIAAE
jgi:DNA-binding NarL/FixJ family response regulator